MTRLNLLFFSAVCTTALFVGAVGPSQADTRYTLRADPAASSPGTPALAMTVSQRGGAERWDITFPQAGRPEDMSILIPANSHRALLLMPNTKGYQTFPLALVPPDPFGIPFVLLARTMPTVSNAQDMSTRKMISTYRIRDVGPAMVNGVRTEHYAVTLRLQMQNAPNNQDMSLNMGLWLAPGKGTATAAERLSPVETVRTPDGTMVTRENQGDRKALAAIAGRMPVKMTMSADGHALTFTLADHSAQPVAAGIFQIPAGYQEITPSATPPTAAPVQGEPTR